ncbi:MAG: hypothetical protein Q7N50_07915 [Armatimonadota bacterium]|nr:hypothetical protein [Armatimonadota bacterium]
MRSQRLYIVVFSPVFGIGVGGATMCLILGLMLRMLPSFADSLVLLKLGVWIHAIIGLSSLAAGVAAAWFRCWGAKKYQMRMLGGEYGFVVACVWGIVLTYTQWFLALSAWPLLLADIILVALAGLIGKRMSRLKSTID